MFSYFFIKLKIFNDYYLYIRDCDCVGDKMDSKKGISGLSVIEFFFIKWVVSVGIILIYLKFFCSKYKVFFL